METNFSPSKNLSKRAWLDYLFYKEGKQNTNFYLCGTFGNRKFTKWRTYLDCIGSLDEINHNERWQDRQFFEQINQRQILPHEVVLDLEEPEQLKPIVEKLKELKWGEYHIFETGSRGYHIHLFGNRDMTTEEKESVVLKLGTDIQKCSEKNLIALENVGHWKTGRMKMEVLI